MYLNNKIYTFVQIEKHLMDHLPHLALDLLISMPLGIPPYAQLPIFFIDQTSC